MINFISCNEYTYISFANHRVIGIKSPNSLDLRKLLQNKVKKLNLHHMVLIFQMSTLTF